MLILRIGAVTVAIVALAGVAWAQAPPPPAVSAAPTAPAAVQPPAPRCIAPRIVERPSVPAEDIAHLRQLTNDYAHCMKAYVDARRAAAEAAGAQEKAEVDAGNAAAHQLNDLYAAVKAYAAEHAKD